MSQQGGRGSKIPFYLGTFSRGEGVKSLFYFSFQNMFLVQMSQNGLFFWKASLMLWCEATHISYRILSCNEIRLRRNSLGWNVVWYALKSPGMLWYELTHEKISILFCSEKLPGSWWWYCNYSFNLQVQVSKRFEIVLDIETFIVYVELTWTHPGPNLHPTWTLPAPDLDPTWTGAWQ